MKLGFLDKGTALNIEILLLSNDELVYEFEAKLFDTLGYTTIEIECDELYHLFNEDKNFDDKFYLKINFNQGFKSLFFRGKIKNLSENAYSKLIYINQVSDVKESIRRSYPRLDIAIDLSIYNNDNQLVLSGSTSDISIEGLCLFSNKLLEANIENYILEFSLNKKDIFVLPAKLIRRGDCPQRTKFKYDYGFLFDFSNMPDEKSRIVTSLFNYKMKIQ